MQTDLLTGQKSGRIRWSTNTKRTVGIIILIAAALVAYVARVVFVPMIIGGIIAYLLYPVARLVGRITRLPHGLAALLLYVLALVLLIPGGILLTPLLSDQIRGLQKELTALVMAPENLTTPTLVLLPGIELSLSQLVGELGAVWQGLIHTAASESLDLLFGASKTFLLVIFTFFIAYYLTADADKIVAWLRGLIPAAYREDMADLLAEINEVWAAFFRGQALLAVAVTVIITALSFAIGLPQPLLMGILAGVLEFLVSAGHTIWLIIALVVALVDGSTYLPVSHEVFALIVVGTNLVFTKFDLNILIPAIVGSRVRLHPMVVLIGIIVGASIGGVLGIALAAPTIASLRVIGRYVYDRLFDQEPAAEPVVESVAAKRMREQTEAAC
jgi:predicted PurR-regulated permease PerM